MMGLVNLPSASFQCPLLLGTFPSQNVRIWCCLLVFWTFNVSRPKVCHRLGRLGANAD